MSVTSLVSMPIFVQLCLLIIARSPSVRQSAARPLPLCTVLKPWDRETEILQTHVAHPLFFAARHMVSNQSSIQVSMKAALPTARSLLSTAFGTGEAQHHAQCVLFTSSDVTQQAPPKAALQLFPILRTH